MEKEKNIKFPNGFFTQPKPHINKKEDKKDNIPFKWSENVIKGKTKAEIVSKKNDNISFF